MNLNKISSAFEYVNWALLKFKEYQGIEKNIYRIVEIKQFSSSKYKLITQIIGKSTVIELTPEEIVTNDKIFSGFSKSDVRTITYYACQNNKLPKYKVIMQEFCEKLNKILFKIKNINDNKIILKTAAQIFLDKNIINNLSPQDIGSISYAAGYEQSYLTVD